MNVAWHPMARAELIDAAAYYEAKQSQLGESFVGEVERAIEQVLCFPEAWPRISPASRRIRTRRFPYGVVYQIRGELIHVIALMHLRRQPGYWRDREAAP